MKTVFVGMSGGVDSSVTAALLKNQGCTVVGVYMKNWTQDFPGSPCTWKEDFQDAKRVAVQLGIDFKVFDFQKEYRQKVVNYMVGEYLVGRTPNPDIMCNQEVKFKLFLDASLEEGADMIATGHYTRVVNSNEQKLKPKSSSLGLGSRSHDADHTVKNKKAGQYLQSQLHVASNLEKDQSYFLYRVTQQALDLSLMPIGDYKTKAEVRAIAKKFGLATADKKDSQGICFVGKVGIKDFLLQELGPQKRGEIIDQNGNVIGTHEGAIFYTIGQRHGLDVGGGLPYYVVGKDMVKNQVFVTSNIDDQKLWHDEITLSDVHWINSAPVAGQSYQVRTRYRAPLIKAKLAVDITNGSYILKLTEPAKALTPGQSTVIYEDGRVVGGGIVA